MEWYWLSISIHHYYHIYFSELGIMKKLTCYVVKHQNDRIDTLFYTIPVWFTLFHFSTILFLFILWYLNITLVYKFVNLIEILMRGGKQSCLLQFIL